jgi:hypothetical protein
MPGLSDQLCPCIRNPATPLPWPQFVAEFFTFEPLEQLDRAPAHLVSPWSLLEWQVGGASGRRWGFPQRWPGEGPDAQQAASPS